MKWEPINFEAKSWLNGYSGFECGRWRVVQMNHRIGDHRPWHINFKEERGWVGSWGFRKRFVTAEAAMNAIKKQLERTPTAA